MGVQTPDGHLFSEHSLCKCCMHDLCSEGCIICTRSAAAMIDTCHSMLRCDKNEFIWLEISVFDKSQGHTDHRATRGLWHRKDHGACVLVILVAILCYQEQLRFVFEVHLQLSGQAAKLQTNGSGESTSIVTEVWFWHGPAYVFGLRFMFPFLSCDRRESVVPVGAAEVSMSRSDDDSKAMCFRRAKG